jgi:hypothetical protein
MCNSGAEVIFLCDQGNQESLNALIVLSSDQGDNYETTGNDRD